jgi:hypothetical protein
MTDLTCLTMMKGSVSRRVDGETAERLHARGRMLQEELEQCQWRGEQVYRTPAHNAMSSHAIVDQLMPLLPKEDKEAAEKAKHLYALLDVATLTDATFVNEAER